MSLSDLGSYLAIVGKENPKHYVPSFASKSCAIQDALIAEDTVKSEFYWDGSQDGLNWIRFLSIFSDRVSIVTRPQPIRRQFWDIFQNVDLEQVDIPPFIADIEAQFGVGARRAYLSFQPKEIHEAVSIIAPLMERGFALLRPEPLLLVPSSTTGMTIDGFEFWGAPLRSHREGTALVTEIESPSHSDCFQVTIPFFDGISISALAQLLEDENDSLVRARAAIRKSLRQASKDGLTLSQYIRDELNPEMSLLNQKLVRLRRYQMFSALSIVPATLVLTRSNSFNWWQLVPQGFHLVSNALAQPSDLRESPYHFWWRLQRARR